VCEVGLLKDVSRVGFNLWKSVLQKEKAQDIIEKVFFAKESKRQKGREKSFGICLGKKK